MRFLLSFVFTCSLMLASSPSDIENEFSADKEETLFDLTDVTNYVVDQNQIFFYRPDNPYDAESKGDLIQKSINGEEEVLVHSIRCRCLNKKGAWLYFSDDDKVYKLNVAKKGKKQESPCPFFITLV